MSSSAMSISERLMKMREEAPEVPHVIVPRVIHSVNKTGGYNRRESLSTYRKVHEKSRRETTAEGDGMGVWS